MVNENFTAQQWIDYFLDKLQKGETVTVNDLLEAVKTVSVKDPVAAKDAYVLVSNALPDRIFATDELKTLLETLSDGAKICGFDAAREVVAAA